MSFSKTFQGKKPNKTKEWLEIKKALKKYCRKCTNYRCYQTGHEFVNGQCVWCPLTEIEHIENRRLANEVFKRLEMMVD